MYRCIYIYKCLVPRFLASNESCGDVWKLLRATKPHLYDASNKDLGTGAETYWGPSTWGVNTQMQALAESKIANK